MTVRTVATRILGLSALIASTLAIPPATAEDFGPILDTTADGTWDCQGPGETAIGAVVIVESAYAFINPDSKVAGYGKLHRIAEADVLLPAYVVIDGPLKDDHGLVGAAMRGPADDKDNYSGALFLGLTTVDNQSAECTRRLIEGRRQ